ncbi:MAG: AMP-binding protein [Clostridia bacterium]|nr:AMP-binding protein [Clostridia bacterium]
MSERLYKTIQITDLKNMLNKTKNLYADKPAYKIKIENGKYKIISHLEVRQMIDCLGTALIDMGLKNKRIAVIGENRYEWEIAYLSIVCGTGIVVPLDKSLPENELESVIERSGVEAIFYSEKYEEILKKIKYSETNKLKHLISMDNCIHENGIYSQEELIQKGSKLIENGNREFIDAKINPEEMSIMLFTSGTTSRSKVVALSHKNISSNLMDIGSILDVNENDTILSILPIHHVFECTVGFLFSLYKGAQTVFCDGLRHVLDNLKEYNVSVMACVPGIYERIFMQIRKQMEKQGKLDEILANKEKYPNATMEKRKEIFKEIHDLLGGNIKLFISGAAALDPQIEQRYRDLGINIVQGYGLTETSPVVAICTNKEYRLGSIGKSVPSVEAKLENINSEGIGELVVKGPSIALGYYEDIEKTKESFKNGWFYTGDLAKIDEDGYIYICGRKKSVIVLKNGKNIFPEEMENLVNKIEGVKESFVFGKQLSDDKDNIKINVEIVFDREILKNAYKAETDEDIYKRLFDKIKEINNQMPKYKAIRGMILTENPLIKTTTNKIKRQANLDAINELKY